MTKKPNQADVEKVALEFAKELIDTSNGWMSAGIDDELMRRATGMAIDWLAGEDLRSNIVEQHYPNWVDLSEKSKNPSIEMGKKYWFVANQIDSRSNSTLPEVIEGRVIDIHELFGILTVKVEDVINAIDYKAMYFIPKDYSVIFDQSFQPLPPEGVEVKNNKFSPTMSLQD